MTLDETMRRAIERAKFQLHLERKRAARIEREITDEAVDREHKKNAAKHGASKER